MHPLQAARLSAPDMIIQVDIRISDLVRKNENIDLISDMNRGGLWRLKASNGWRLCDRDLGLCNSWERVLPRRRSGHRRSGLGNDSRPCRIVPPWFDL
jgi:hypothetical protein